MPARSKSHRDPQPLPDSGRRPYGNGGWVVALIGAVVLIIVIGILA